MARFAKIKELDLAMLGTQTASIFTLRFAENAESNVPKWIRSEAQTLHTVFETERYFENYYIYNCLVKSKKSDLFMKVFCFMNSTFYEFIIYSICY
jgi:hypothetical protein